MVGQEVPSRIFNLNTSLNIIFTNVKNIPSLKIKQIIHSYLTNVSKPTSLLFVYTRLTNGSNKYSKDTLLGTLLAPSKLTFILPLTERRTRLEEHCVVAFVSHKISDDDLAKEKNTRKKTISSKIKVTMDTKQGTNPVNIMIKIEIYACSL